MEPVSGKSSGHGSLVIKKEDAKRDVESNGDIEEDSTQDFAHKIGNGRSYNDEIENDQEKKRLSPKQKDLIKQNNNQLESTKAEMGEVREENVRLKTDLGRIMKEYQTLQMQFNNIVQQEASKISTMIINPTRTTPEETELVSLTLGSFSGLPKTNCNKDDKYTHRVAPASKYGKETMAINDNQEGLSLGLDCKYASEPSNKSGATDQGGPSGSNPSAESSFEERKEEAGETWPPSKALKPVKRATPEQDEVLESQNPAKKARVCVRARCDTPTMNDGCQWRKYGQKIAKGNPCPRAYYRCTVAPSCPVRKQVQRCANDMSILITTYEGTHNHPLTAAATAMASTTSAAATMLLSGSSSSSSGTRPDALAGFNTYESSNNNNNKHFYMPNNTSTYSSFQASHPTITLDLTSTHLPNPNSNNNNNSSHHFLNKFSSNSNTYPSSSLSFGSSDSNTTNNNVSWGNYGTSSAQAQQYRAALGSLGRQISTPFSQNPNTNNNSNYYPNYIHHKISTTNSNPSSTNDSSAIAAATKAITADPTFQSALAAALTSIIGGGQGSNGSKSSNILQGEVVPNLKWPIVSSGDHQLHFPATTSSATNNALSITGCASTFLNKNSSPVNPPAAVGSPMMFLSSNSLSFSTSKSASASPDEG